MCLVNNILTLMKTVFKIIFTTTFKIVIYRLLNIVGKNSITAVIVESHLILKVNDN